MDDVNLFSQFAARPLADRMRPETLDEIVGQTHLIAKGRILRNLIENDAVDFFHRVLLHRAVGFVDCNILGLCL